MHYALKAVRDAGCLAGLAICPGTPAGLVHEVAHDIDILLCMTVNPGWGGQAFIEHSIQKLERLQAAAAARGRDRGGRRHRRRHRAALRRGGREPVRGRLGRVRRRRTRGIAYEEIERSVNG